MMTNYQDGGADGVWDDFSSPSSAVVERIAAETDTDPAELPPLYESIDPDALDSLLSGGRQTDAQLRGQVHFSYAGYDVAVRGDGQISIDPRTRPLEE